MSHRCEACPFPRGKCMPPQPVKNKGGLFIIGESPGIQEIAKKEPFVGPAGEVLRKTMASVGIPNLGDAHLTTALLCAPPKGKANNKTAIRSCAVRLHEELREAEPSMILALGNVSLHAVTGNFDLKITREQGKFFNTEFGPMIPALHPAMVLRSPGTYKGFRSALSYTVKLSKGHKPKDPGESRFAVVPSAVKAAEVIKKLMDMPGATFAVDIETTGFNPRQDRILCVGIAWDKNKTIIFPAKFVPMLKNLLESKDKTFVWHNGKFDSEFLYNVGIDARVDEDVMLLHYALNEIKGTHDLEQLSVQELGAEPYEHHLKPYLGKDKTYADIPTKVLYPYLAKDADYTRQLYFIFKEAVNKSNDLKNVYNKILMPASAFLQKVERKGIYVDKKHILALDAQLSLKSQEIRDKISRGVAAAWDPAKYMSETGAKTAPAEFNPGSSQQLKWLLYKQLGMHPPRGMAANTREATLVAIRPRIKLIDYILELRGVEKQWSTYVKGIMKEVEKDNRVHCSFLIHGTETGRLSSREPNMQNIPRDGNIRNIFVPQPGHIFIEADYKGAELRVLAYLSDDDFLSEVFRQGRDLHTEVAINMYGKDFTESQRVRAKAINFGIPYGRGARDIAREFDMSVREAESMIARWFERAPKAYKYLTEVRDAVGRGKVLRAPLGRLRRFGLVSRETIHAQENQASNFAIQSTASDMTLISAIMMQPLLEELGGHVVNLVHDSILVEVPDTDGAVINTSKIVAATMANTPDLLLQSKIPFEIELKKGYRWGDLQEFEIKDLHSVLKTQLIAPNLSA